MVTMQHDKKVENTTSDVSGKNITDEIESDKDTVEIFTIDELAPSSIPITVPYVEFYRTNELEYVPYMSPYNVGVQSTSDDGSSGDSSDTNNENNENSENSDNNNENNENNENSSEDETTQSDL